MQNTHPPTAANADVASFRRNIFTLLLLAFSGSVIYGLPYFRLYYYDAYAALYSLSNEQMGKLGSAYGLLGLLSYLIGGYLADRASAKKLLVFSLFATGALGFLHYVISDFYVLLGIYAIWGFTSLLTFWPACVKVISSLASEAEQSRAFGVFEGGRGVFSAADLALTTAIFAYFAALSLDGVGIKYIILFYSSTPIGCAILLMLLLKDPARKPTKTASTLGLREFLAVLKIPAVYLASAITFCSYSFNLSFYYFSPFASNGLGIAATLAAMIGISHQYVRPFAAPSGGFLADRFGKAQMMIAGFCLCIAGVGAFVFCATSGVSNAAVFIVCAGICAAGMYINYGVYMSLLKEGGVKFEQLGMAVGLACTIGYLPEILVPLLAGKILDAYEPATYGAQGYLLFYKILLGVGVLGILLCCVWIKFIKKSNEEEK